MAENKNNILSKLPFAIPAVHCIGIGGIGVSAIAELLLDCGCKVSGSDMELNSNCAHLSKLGAAIAPAGHRAENVPDHPLGGGIMTAAADMTNPEVQALLLKKALVWRRGEFLGELCKAYKRPVMVAGSHGKSSVSAMLGWIFKQCSIETALLLGAHYQDHSRNACAGNGDILIAEADESDNSIKYLSGELALITNIDGDHAWDAKALDAQYKAFLSFGKAFKKVICVDSENCRNVLNGLKNVEALDSKRIAELGAMVPERFVGYERINAALALAGAEYLKISLADAAGALASYPGLQRRQSELLRSRKFVLLEDYAHHPAELAASLEVIKKRYPDHQITLLFQPHRYQRLQHYFKEFTEILSDKALNVKVLPVFSAWEPPKIDALDNADLAAALCRAGGKASVMHLQPVEAERMVEELGQNSGKQLIAMIGAGDLEILIPAIKAAIMSVDSGSKEE